MSRADPRFDDWKSKAMQADILAEAVARGAKLKRAGREHVGACPACGGRDRFSINTQKRIFNCRGSGGGDVVGMVMHIDGVSFLQACEALTGEPPPNGQARPLSDAEKTERAERRARNEAAQRRREAEEAAYQDNTREAAQRIWDESQPISGTVAEAYLNRRGFDGPDGGWPGVLRFHKSLPHANGKRYPALICRVDDSSSDLTAIWRIYLSPDGAKADVPNPKMGLGPSSGGAVRIGGPARRIGVAEGIESALGAWLLIGRAYPVWAALSTAGMTGFEPPVGVNEISIFPDGDAPITRKDGEFVPARSGAGMKAAKALKASMDEIGVACVIAQEPPAGRDYCDLWAAMKDDAA